MLFLYKCFEQFLYGITASVDIQLTNSYIEYLIVIILHELFSYIFPYFYFIRLHLIFFIFRLYYHSNLIDYNFKKFIKLIIYNELTWYILNLIAYYMSEEIDTWYLYPLEILTLSWLNSVYVYDFTLLFYKSSMSERLEYFKSRPIFYSANGIMISLAFYIECPWLAYILMYSLYMSKSILIQEKGPKYQTYMPKSVLSLTTDTEDLIQICISYLIDKLI